ncbi:cobalt-precorrin 5A hydrolase [Sinanaerobacter chloroacetimidivorans]|uniref:Cobalt-precorrin 5A hydrolase n=1 Tax=Sinanaerobacter chloroacetimidivorans TaxID=2818044 RepID=A0A8J8B167_9FIRM|nr:cobalt-precorrin 5A hydrolase [Sinanaerobacter chloroacetimidivorans]MBR0597341.1 cobalt-precorrin 5A hydrolase [Sinanaerobacter chloroacetimidivorans]
MKISMISFTKAGADTCIRIQDALTSNGHDCIAWGKEAFASEPGILPLKNSLLYWTKTAFQEREALIFVGATGIAVRAIALYLRDKTVDPAVVVVDEKGKYAVSLLSGHLGGANDLTREIAESIGAEPVITTATDLNHKFSVDDWAKKNRLRIGDMNLAKEISAAVLNEEVIGVSSDFDIEGEPPEQILFRQAGKNITYGLRISIYEEPAPFPRTLFLIPKTVTVGIGCRKGISREKIEEGFYKVLDKEKISVNAIEKLCSIDLKKEEPAITQLAEKLEVPFWVFSAEELGATPGDYTPSDFVNRITGVDNVCERAAVLGSQGELIVKKQAINDVTIAIAVRKEGYQWR